MRFTASFLLCVSPGFMADDNPLTLSDDDEIGKISKVFRKMTVNLEEPATVRGRKCAIEWPQDGFCSLCVEQTKISKAGWVRHLKRKHKKELLEAEKQRTSSAAQTTLDAHVVKENKVNRLFVLYAASSTFPVNHVNNKYLQVREKTGLAT